MPTFADTTFANAQDLAARCARRTMNTWHVLDDRGHYLIADDADAAAWGDRIVWSIEPEMAFSATEMDDVPTDNPDIDSTPGDYGPSPLRRPSLYERIVVECQAELDARMVVPDYHTVSRSPFCALPDNLCSVHDPCPAHAADAARYLAQQSLDTWQPMTALIDGDLPF